MTHRKKVLSDEAGLLMAGMDCLQQKKFHSGDELPPVAGLRWFQGGRQWKNVQPEVEMLIMAGTNCFQGRAKEKRLQSGAELPPVVGMDWLQWRLLQKVQLEAGQPSIGMNWFEGTNCFDCYWWLEQV